MEVFLQQSHLTTRICLVRHGETGWNAQSRIQGHMDEELNARGIAQARATAHGLRGHEFKAIYSSDLSRASATAGVIASVLNLDVSTRTDLRERHYGCAQALTYDEVREHHPDEYRRFLERDPDHAFPGGGESLQEFSQRIRNALAEIACTHSGQQVLVVTHGGALDIVNRFVRGNPLHTPRDFTIPNCSLNWVEHGAQGWRMVSWAGQSHLDKSLDELPG